MPSSDGGVILWCQKLGLCIKAKRLLTGLDFCAVSGGLTVIMGPSGSGKTTLLNCLTKRIDNHDITGQVNLNSDPVTAEIVRKYFHYVMAQDMALGHLTVFETLKFAARLRMPHQSQETRLSRVEKLMELLDLQDCRNTYVGTEWRKGISKGQLKRLMVAQELFGECRVLILDEPTTGLDSCLALDLISTLKRTAQEFNIAVIASIHQPSQRAFALFDVLALMSNGHMIYHGPACNASEYFIDKSFKREAGVTIPDFLLEVASVATAFPSSGESSPLTAIGEPRIGGKFDLEERPESSGFRHHISDGERESEALAADFNRSELYTKLTETQNAASKADGLRTQLNKRCWRVEFSTLWFRSTINSLRNPITTSVILIVNILQALVLGGLFFQLRSSVPMSSGDMVSIRDWSLWTSAPMEYLAYGIGPKGEDPILRTIYEGVDGKGRFLLFDSLTNQEVLDYLVDSVRCIREKYDDELIKPRGIKYPPYNWFVNRRSDQNRQSLIIQPYLNDTISTVVSLAQILDFTLSKRHGLNITKNLRPPEFMDFEMSAWWVDVYNAIEPLVTPAFCCLGSPMGGGAVPKRCSAIYKKDVLPSVPKRLLGHLPTGYWSNKKVSDIQSNVILRLLEEKTWNIEALSIQNRSSMKHRRKLGATLGGLVKDMKNLAFDAGANFAYSNLISSLVKFFKRLYKETVEKSSVVIHEYANWLVEGFENIGYTVLAVLNIAGATFFGVANLGFSCYDVLLQFPKDRHVFNREVANGVHSTSSYFFAKMIADLPFQILPCVIWTTIYFLLTGIGSGILQFGAYLAISLLVTVCSYSFGYAISSLAPRLEVAVVLAPLFLVVMLVLSGFFLRDPDFPLWIGWIKYFSIYRWGFFGLCTVLFPSGTNFGFLPNDLILPLLGVVEKRALVNAGWLVVLIVGYRTVAFFGLKYTNRQAGMQS